jgi:misacylated tRNA(Ala) deacylase
MSEGLYLHDAYLTSFSATVTAAVPQGIELDRTAFYPTGGGQPADRGQLLSEDGRTWPVLGAEKSGGTIVHQMPDGGRPSLGDAVKGTIDWNRRYVHMRYHTALHVLSGVVYRRFGSGITGGQISETGARMDFSLPEFQRSTAEGLIDEANSVGERGLPVSVRFVRREELEANPELVRVDPRLVPEGSVLRLIDIEGFDVQADGGTHVRSTAEIGTLRLDRIENKGARNKRLYVVLGAASHGTPD